MKKEFIETVHTGPYTAPQCDVLALEGGQVMDNGSGTLPIIIITEEEW